MLEKGKTVVLSHPPPRLLKRSQAGSKQATSNYGLTRFVGDADCDSGNNGSVAGQNMVSQAYNKKPMTVISNAYA